MIFTYVYKKADNIRRTGTIQAKSRDAAFSALHAQGIRPIRVTAPPPTILSRIGRRGLAIIILSTLVGLLSTFLAWDSWYARMQRKKIIEPTFRHAVLGVEMSEDSFSILFDKPCERFLAWFAQPGLQIELPAFTDELAERFTDGLTSPMCRRTDDSVAATEFRAVVAGMKEEAIRFLRTGCSVRDYAEMLMRRQQQEVAYRSEKKHEYEILLLRGDTAATARFLESANAELRVMGMPPLPRVVVPKPQNL